MSNSGRKINYAVRPAKNIERKMLRDMFNCLQHYTILRNYRYIGFGAKYFSDFALFHRHLGIEDMISIEADCTNTERYEFNKPYSCIKIRHGKSTDLLPEISDSNKRTLYWLDYDGYFEPYMLIDAAIVARSIAPGSVYSVSFNCTTPQWGPILTSTELEAKLIELVGKEYVQPNIDPRGWTSSKKLAAFLKNCLYKEIQKILSSRNIGLGQNDQLKVEQIMFFKYADGCDMATVTFAFYKSSEEHIHKKCNFNDLYFFRPGDEPFEIKTPNLTMKEIRHIMETMPKKEKLSKKIFTEKDIDSLWENYRYFPSFSELETF